MRAAIAGWVRSQEGSGLPQPGSSQRRHERETCSMRASAEASPCGSPVRRAAIRSASNSRTRDRPSCASSVKCGASASSSHAGQDTGQFPRCQGAQQSVGERDGRTLPRAGGEGIDHLTQHVMRHRHGRQSNTLRQLAQQGPQLGCFSRMERPGAIQAQGQRRGGRRFDQQCHQGHAGSQPGPLFAQQQGARHGRDAQHRQDQQCALQPVEPAMRIPDRIHSRPFCRCAGPLFASTSERSSRSRSNQ